MKKKVIALLVLFAFAFNVSIILSQETNNVFDTTLIYRKGNKQKYSVTGTKINEIKLSGYGPKLATHKIGSIEFFPIGIPIC